MRQLTTTLVLTVLLFSSVSYAQTAPQQQKPTPEEVQKMMDATFGAMVPMMTKMTEAIIEAQLRIGTLPDTADRMATFKRNLFDSLVKKGFTADQALQIVIATSVPSVTPPMN